MRSFTESFAEEPNITGETTGEMRAFCEGLGEMLGERSKRGQNNDENPQDSLSEELSRGEAMGQTRLVETLGEAQNRGQIGEQAHTAESSTGNSNAMDQTQPVGSSGKVATPEVKLASSSCAQGRALEIESVLEEETQPGELERGLEEAHPSAASVQKGRLQFEEVHEDPQLHAGVSCKEVERAEEEKEQDERMFREQGSYEESAIGVKDACKESSARSSAASPKEHTLLDAKERPQCKEREKPREDFEEKTDLEDEKGLARRSRGVSEESGERVPLGTEADARETVPASSVKRERSEQPVLSSARHNVGYNYDVTSREFKKAMTVLTNGKRSLLLCANPGPRRDSFLSTLAEVFRHNGYTIYTLTSVGDWDRMGPVEGGSFVLFDRAFGDVRLDRSQYQRFYQHGMYRVSGLAPRVKLVFVVYPHVLAELRQFDPLSHLPLLDTVQVVPLPHQPFSVPAYVDLFLRMLCDPDHGQVVGALLALTMRGQGCFMNYPGRAAPVLKRLCFQQYSEAQLEQYACLYEGSLLAPGGGAFIDRAVYEAAGLALSCHFQAALLQACDGRFLVQRVSTEQLAAAWPSSLALGGQGRRAGNQRLLMQRLYDDMMAGRLQEMSQHPCLHSAAFLRQFKDFCQERLPRKRARDRLQLLVSKVEKERRLSLLYCAVWVSAVLAEWCLDVMAEQRLDSADLSRQVQHAAFAAAILSAHRDEDVTQLVQRLRDHLARVSPPPAQDSLSLPLPAQQQRYTEALDAVCRRVTLTVGQRRFYYLGQPARAIPDSLLAVQLLGDVIHVVLPVQRPYLTFRLLADRAVDEQDVQGNTLLHLAAEQGVEEVVKLAVLSGASLTVRNQRGLTPPDVAAQRAAPQRDPMKLEGHSGSAIHRACLHRDLAAVKCLLCQTSTPHDLDESGRTPLHLCCGLGDTHVASLLVRLKGDVNARDPWGHTPLHYACSGQRKAAVEFLIAEGADVNARDKAGMTPLHILCVENGDADIGEVLLRNGARVNARSAASGVPLLYALARGHLALAEVLCQHKARVNIPTVRESFRSKLLALNTTDEDKIGKLFKALTAEVDYSEDDEEDEDNGDPQFSLLNSMSLAGVVAGVRFLLDHGARLTRRESGESQELHQACRHGHTEVARILLEHGVDVNSPTSNGNTALYVAADGGHVETVHLLLSMGADVSGGRGGGFPLHVACYNGSTQIAEMLLQHGADVNHQASTEGLTPLMFALIKGHSDTARLLLRHGADASLRADNGCSPLRAAYEFCPHDLLAALIQHGADPDEPDDTVGATILHRESGKGRADVVRLLIENGADIHLTIPGLNDATALAVASVENHTDVMEVLLLHGAEVDRELDKGSTALLLACSNGRLEAARLLLQHHAAVNKADSHGNTALLFACEKGYTEIVRLLLLHHVDVNAVNLDGYRALYVASLHGHHDIVTLLLDHQADVNRLTSGGASPLLVASAGGHADIVRSLLAGGAEVNAVTEDGCSALFTACSMGHLHVARLLLQHGADPESGQAQDCYTLHRALFHGHAEIAQLLLQHGAKPDTVTSSGLSTLHCAAYSGDARSLSQVLQHGGLDINAKECTGHSALELALLRRHTDCVRLLVQQERLDVNQATKDGVTPLIVACFKQDLPTASLLLQHPAVDVNRAGRLGITPLFAACHKGSPELVQLLVRAGADVKAESPLGGTVLDWAVKNEEPEVVAVLRQGLAQHSACLSQQHHDEVVLVN